MIASRRRQRTGCQLAIDRGERIVERIHEDTAHGIDHQSARAVLGFDHGRAAAGRAGRIVQRPDQPRLALDEGQRLLLVPGVVAERHGIGAGVEQFASGGLGDAEAAGCVLAIGDHQIELPVAHQLGQALIDNGSPAASDNVANQQNPHAHNLIATESNPISQHN